MCGNSLGVQPRLASQRVNEHFLAWAKKGVTGHFRGHTDTPLPPFLDDDERASRLISPLVGANISEVVAMETLTANLQLMMTSFYRPTKEKYKIILEGKAFPSDHVGESFTGPCTYLPMSSNGFYFWEGLLQSRSMRL